MVGHRKWTRDELEERRAALEDELKRALETRPVEAILEQIDAVDFLLEGFEENNG